MANVWQHATAEAAFKAAHEDVVQKIEALKQHVEQLKTKAEQHPNDWGYAGSMVHIEEQLDEILGNKG